jgi:hypothetical protein
MTLKLPIKPVLPAYDVFDNVWLTHQDMKEIGIKPGEELHVWSDCEKSKHIVAKCLPWMIREDQGHIMVNSEHFTKLQGKQSELKEVYVEKAAFKHKLKYEKNFRDDFYVLLGAILSSIILAIKDVLKFYLTEMQVSVIITVFAFVILMISLLRLFLKVGKVFA